MMVIVMFRVVGMESSVGLVVGTAWIGVCWGIVSVSGTGDVVAVVSVGGT